MCKYNAWKKEEFVRELFYETYLDDDEFNPELIGYEWDDKKNMFKEIQDE